MTPRCTPVAYQTWRAESLGCLTLLLGVTVLSARERFLFFLPCCNSDIYIYIRVRSSRVSLGERMNSRSGGRWSIIGKSCTEIFEEKRTFEECWSAVEEDSSELCRTLKLNLAISRRGGKRYIFLEGRESYVTRGYIWGSYDSWRLIR